jgi:hypothetical protein
VDEEGPERPGTTEEEVAEAMGCITALERWLWGRAVERNIRNRDSRWRRMLPKNGREGATLSIVGSVWALPGFLGFVAIPLLYGNDSGSTIREALGILFAAIAVVSISFSWWRTLRAVRVGRKFRAGLPKPS